MFVCFSRENCQLVQHQLQLWPSNTFHPHRKFCRYWLPSQQTHSGLSANKCGLATLPINVARDRS